MADILGALTLPVTTAQAPIGDPLRQKLGGFLQAAIRSDCGTAWTQIGGIDSDVVARVETNDPSDNTFSTAKLPCLALFRGSRGRRPVQLADDVRYRESQIIALWIPPPVPQAHRASRESFFQAVEAAVDKALRIGRTPNWKVVGDADPLTATQGSLLDKYLGLLRPIALGVGFEDSVVEIEMVGQPPKRYPALQITFQVWENWTFAAPVDPNKSEATMTTNGDLVQEWTVP